MRRAVIQRASRTTGRLTFLQALRSSPLAAEPVNSNGTACIGASNFANVPVGGGGCRVLSSISRPSAPGSYIGGSGIAPSVRALDRRRLVHSSVQARAQATSQQTRSASAMTSSEETIVVEKDTSAATVVLNRPKALNSLDTYMVKRMKQLYTKWEQDPAVKMILLKANGRAFCAGGDVRTVYQQGKQGKVADCCEFFRSEYELNYLIACLTKPHVALINGVVFGGGNGISMHGPFRVVTENAVFAMPETAIGLHPDVGASYFLSRLPGHMGEYLALSGARVLAPDMLSLGLATHFIPSDRLPSLENRLGCIGTGDPEAIHLAIQEHAERVLPAKGGIISRAAVIDACFSKSTVEGVFTALLNHASATSASHPGWSADDAAWAAETHALLARMSPTALKVSFRSVRDGRMESLAQCLQKEYRLSVRACNEAVTGDFYEGVRAVLVDKDGKPKWNPVQLSQVSARTVSSLFEPLSPNEELRLPVRGRAHGARL
ncbi:hypothetical protein CLOM_g16183 [Closterium sp. NIES-68]|nr:hypothetical protein CLOM_g16183 [Closterium sp. NIES-68]GJP72303.1 hypothetical protein CLOP_g3050 [Closterium sp. NIES-67]